MALTYGLRAALLRGATLSAKTLPAARVANLAMGRPQLAPASHDTPLAAKRQPR